MADSLDVDQKNRHLEASKQQDAAGTVMVEEGRASQTSDASRKTGTGRADEGNCSLGSVEYAIGRNKPGEGGCSSTSECLCPTCFPRIGNMVVLCSAGWGKESAKRICCVVGPYWPMMACVTYPLIFVIALATGFMVMAGKHIGVVIVFGAGVSLTVAFLALTACSNPGIMRRVIEDPSLEGDKKGAWKWDHTAGTYRPKDAEYCCECNVVIEGFDHTCPWTGTAIGKGNQVFFHGFNISCCGTLLFIFVVFAFVRAPE